MGIERVASNAGYTDVVKTAPKTEHKTEPAVSAPIQVTDADIIPIAYRSSDMGKGSDAGSAADEKTEKRIKDAVTQANNKIKMAAPRRTKCEFMYHEKSKRVSIKMIDEETQEVVKEIPPEETIRMIEKMWELAGIMIDEKR